jgi:hypothetical protein
MKKILLLAVLFIGFNSFAQSSLEINQLAAQIEAQNNQANQNATYKQSVS